MLGEWPEATEAALCMAYSPRKPIREFWQGRITLRELAALVRGLPDDSAMHKADPDLMGWRTTEHLLARLNDGIAAVFQLLVAVNSENGSYEPPKPLPRPGSQEWEDAIAEVDPLAKERARSFMQGVLDQLLPGG